MSSIFVMEIDWNLFQYVKWRSETEAWNSSGLNVVYKYNICQILGVVVVVCVGGGWLAPAEIIQTKQPH